MKNPEKNVDYVYRIARKTNSVPYPKKKTFSWIGYFLLNFSGAIEIRPI